MGPERTCIPDFDRLVNATRDNLGAIGRKLDVPDRFAEFLGMRILLLRLELECTCTGSQERSDLAKDERFGAQSAPESQTLIVLSQDPDTILLPSGENWTEAMGSLWALAFSVMRFREPAREARRRQFWPGRGNLEAQAHLNPRL